MPLVGQVLSMYRGDKWQWWLDPTTRLSATSDVQWAILAYSQKGYPNPLLEAQHLPLRSILLAESMQCRKGAAEDLFLSMEFNVCILGFNLININLRKIY